MSKLDDYVTSQNEKLDAMSVSLEGIVKDIQDLKDSLANDEISDESQAKLDALSKKSEELAEKMSVLDAENPGHQPPNPV